MKLAFSILGCPDFDWSDIYSLAKDFGFDGIEMRGLGDDIFAVNARPFRADQIDKTVAQLRRMRLTIPCLSTGCVLKQEQGWEETREEIRAYIRLAARLGSSYIRLLADRCADVEGPVDDEVVLRHLREVLPQAEEAGVVLLLETNGVLRDVSAVTGTVSSASSSVSGIAQAASDKVQGFFAKRHHEDAKGLSHPVSDDACQGDAACGDDGAAEENDASRYFVYGDDQSVATEGELSHE